MGFAFGVRVGLAAVVAVALAGCAGLATTPPQIDTALAAAEAEHERDLYLQDWQELTVRAQTVFARLALANAELCGNAATVYFGVQLQTLEAFDAEMRPAAERILHAHELPSVVYVWPASAAADAGLKPGDEIVTVNGALIGSGILGRANAIAALRAGGARDGFADVGYRRDGAEREARLVPAKACDTTLTIQRTDTINAYADGTRVLATSGIVRFAADDADLALILSHELAHNTMHHVVKQSANAFAGGVLGALLGLPGLVMGAPVGLGTYSQAFEAEADYVGTYYAARAGYAVDGVGALWRRMAIRNPGTIHLPGSTHPSAALRFLAAEDTAREIAAKHADDQALTPNLKH